FGNIDQLEKIQKHFLRFVAIRLGYDYSNACVDLLANFLSFGSLASRRQEADAFFLKKIITGDIDCPDLLAKVDFRVPTSTRLNNLFFHVCSSTSYLHAKAL
ncbi:hypothetical protein J6590_106261, partial [Homalodisca vitripennis]